MGLSLNITVRLVVLFTLAAPVYAADLFGRVIGVSDGDTFTLLTLEMHQVKIRLAEIDAPESGQPYGDKAKQALSGLIFGKEVRVSVHMIDRYGRTVGRPHAAGIDVCAEMVRIGAAWAYREYLVDQALLSFEADARDERSGIWGLSDSTNVAPWEWRRTGGQDVPNGCNIKGNISSNGARIYHLPGSRSYGATVISQLKGERWFCSEAEAKEAGWRAPHR